jgi:hypothetical protein
VVDYDGEGAIDACAGITSSKHAPSSSISISPSFSNLESRLVRICKALAIRYFVEDL